MKPVPRDKGGWLKRLKRLGPAVWGTVLGTVLILGALNFVVQEAVSYEREEAFAYAQDVNSKIALSDEVHIRSLLASLDKVVLVLRQDFMDKPKLSRRELLHRLDSLKVGDELNPRVSIANAAGEVLLLSLPSTDAQRLSLNLSDRDYFNWHKGHVEDRLYVGRPIKSRLNGTWVLPLTRRINNKDGSFGGVVGMYVAPSLFTDPFEKTSLGTDATRALMGLDGYTLLHLNDGKLGYGGDSRKSQLYSEIKKAAGGCYTAIASSDSVSHSVCYRVIEPYAIVILAGSSVAGIEGLYRAKVVAYRVAAVTFGTLIVLLSGLLILSTLRQRKLLESQKHFNQLIELVPQSISRIDAQGRVQWVNRRTIDYSGPSSEEQARGFDWVMDAVHPEDRGRVKEFLSAALSPDQGIETCEYRKRRFDGAYLWHSSQMTQVTDEHGAPVFFLRTGTDIHDRKMAEERSRVTQKLESIGQLTGGMAHDFNNLLAIIIGNQDLLRSEALSEIGCKRLDVASSAAQRGVGLVKSLLALASKQPLLPARMDLWALVERIAPLLQHAVGQRVNFVMKPPGVSVQVEVDEAGLEAVLLNLVVNARDAMPQGGKLTLALEVSDSMARIAIQDTGTGMPEAVLKRAAEPFFTTKERGHGTGLGLSMVAGFVKQSHGSMKIQSAEGRGTTIELSLPLAQAAKTENIILPPSGTATAPCPLVALSGTRKILIVDDEPALAELVQAWARDHGHTAVVVGTADDALALLAVKAFDVMVTDILMPGQTDGIGLAEKASGLYPAMKILLMSGYSKATATHRAEIPWPLLVKPFHKEDFYAALGQALGLTDFVALA
jgi:PAS domain S-box-containing protein